VVFSVAGAVREARDVAKLGVGPAAR